MLDQDRVIRVIVRREWEGGFCPKMICSRIGKAPLRRLQYCCDGLSQCFPVLVGGRPVSYRQWSLICGAELSCLFAFRLSRRRRRRFGLVDPPPLIALIFYFPSAFSFPLLVSFSNFFAWLEDMVSLTPPSRESSFSASFSSVV